MLRVGITGGIGSGKSTVCAIFEQLGIPVFNADSETKEIYRTHQVLRLQLMKEFGDAIYSRNELNRAMLAEIVFSQPQKLKRLNALVHPLVNSKFEEWCSIQSDTLYVLKEAAILFESESYKRLHKIICVLAPIELRIARVMNRDGVEEKVVKSRIKLQMDQDELAQKCDFLILNDTESNLLPQVIKLHDQLTNLSLETPNPEFIAFR
jgi:dephospho-CoA kinase